MRASLQLMETVAVAAEAERLPVTAADDVADVDVGGVDEEVDVKEDATWDVAAAVAKEQAAAAVGRLT